jgi:putative transposase
MPDYRRYRVPGGSYFFTVTLNDRKSDLLIAQIDLLRTSVDRVRHLMPFHIDAWVVLPDHMHTVWTLPEGDTNFSRRWQTIKMAFSRAIPHDEHLSRSREIRGERGVWQRRFWEHCIRDEQDYAAHVDYVHFNPVKHGFVQTPGAWPYSTFHRAVAQGVYSSAWRGRDVDDGCKGERAT